MNENYLHTELYPLINRSRRPFRNLLSDCPKSNQGTNDGACEILVDNELPAITIRLVVWTHSVVLEMSRHDRIEKLYDIANFIASSNSNETWGFSLRSTLPMQLYLQPIYTIQDCGIVTGCQIIANGRILGGGTIPAEVILYLQCTELAQSEEHRTNQI